MIKSIVLTAVLAGSITYNVTEAFDITKTSVLRVLNVYEVASMLSPFKQSKEEFRVAQNNLYKASYTINPTAQIVYDYDHVSVEDGREIFGRLTTQMRDI